MDRQKPIAALLDFDGVVMDTEAQYSKFWEAQGKKYCPEIENFNQYVKGVTLVQTLNRFFAGREDIQKEVMLALDHFEENMPYEYVPGVQDFVADLRKRGVKTAVVTSSNERKMGHVYRVHPDLKGQFDQILTAGMFTESKPAPDCFLLGAEIFETIPENCFVFEDSFFGLEAGRRAEMNVIALSTSSSVEELQDKAHVVIPDFRDFTFEKMMRIGN